MKKPNQRQRQQPERRKGWAGLTYEEQEIMLDRFRDRRYMIDREPEVMAMHLWMLEIYPDFETCLELVHQAIKENFPEVKQQAAPE
ncbi:MAG: hypothetical protein Q7L07_08085 [Pseudohongiella sp.]|nr:hypothetical protein [Pseudohongiella sp.]